MIDPRSRHRIGRIHKLPAHRIKYNPWRGYGAALCRNIAAVRTVRTRILCGQRRHCRSRSSCHSMGACWFGPELPEWRMNLTVHCPRGPVHRESRQHEQRTGGHVKLSHPRTLREINRHTVVWIQGPAALERVGTHGGTAVSTLLAGVRPMRSGRPLRRPANPPWALVPVDSAWGPCAHSSRKGKPEPAHGWVEGPVAIMVRQPTPRFCRYPGVPKTRVPAPAPAGIRNPTRPNPWSPAVAVARKVRPRSVGVKISHTIEQRRDVVGVNARIATTLQAGGLAFAPCHPLIPRILGSVLRDLVRRIIPGQ